MTGRGWVTGEDIRSRPFLDNQSRENFDKIFTGKVKGFKQVGPNKFKKIYNNVNVQPQDKQYGTTT
jgi:hypothetical protein